MIGAVTSMNQNQFESYGARMIETFLEHWPDDVSLHVYSEDIYKLDFDRVVLHDLYAEAPGLLDFIKKNNGKDSKADYNRQPIKFAHKSYAICAAAESIPERYMIWLDCDIVTHLKIPGVMLQGLTELRYSSYLGRHGFHTEGGFYTFDTEHEIHSLFISAWRDLYDSGELFNLRGWHDCYAYDHLREKFNKEYFFNITPDAKGSDHVFIQSILGDYMDHLKGHRRKQVGRSSKSDLKGKTKTGEYWE